MRLADPAAKLNRCPRCLSEIAEGAMSCTACGARLGESPAASTSQQVATRSIGLRDVLLVAVATMAAAALTFVFLVARGGPSPTLSAASGDAAAEHPASGGEFPATSSTQTWSADNKAFWLANRRGAAFELLAENKVHTFFGPTQPVLVVRCMSKTVDAFVYTRSPTKIEPHAEGKTVTVSIDGEAAKAERWSDSDDRVALFSPDGAAFARRLFHANTLRFGYSPHNADDVVAEFHITGLAELLAPVARECGWKK